jgi:hypothetical protein
VRSGGVGGDGGAQFGESGSPVTLLNARPSMKDAADRLVQFEAMLAAERQQPRTALEYVSRLPPQKINAGGEPQRVKETRQMIRGLPQHDPLAGALHGLIGTAQRPQRDRSLSLAADPRIVAAVHQRMVAMPFRVVER